jgi:uncharacterized protein YjbJ (UPF0337 family)
MNKDQVKGRVEQAKGTVKEATGKVMNDRDLQAEGEIDKTAGKVQADYGDVKEKAKGRRQGPLIDSRRVPGSAALKRAAPSARFHF